MLAQVVLRRYNQKIPCDHVGASDFVAQRTISKRSYKHLSRIVDRDYRKVFFCAKIELDTKDKLPEA